MTPTDLETLRGLLKDKLRDKAEGTRLAYLTDPQEEALTALLADYERMREWILENSQHTTGCAFLENFGNAYFAQSVGCTCGLDALRATLKGEKHD